MHDSPRLTGLALLAAAALMPAPAALGEAPESQPADAHLLAAQAALQDDDYLRAVREYRKAAELSDDPKTAFEATRAAFVLGFNDEARLAVRRWLELDSDSEEALFYRARIELRAGDVREARRAFQVLIDRGGEPPDQLLYRLLQVFAGEDPVTVDKLVRLLAKPYADSALANYAAAATALQAGDYEYAKERALTAAGIDPEWVKPKLLYARALLLDGDEDAAIDYTARIIGDAASPDPDARIELALMFMSVGRDDDALSQVNQVLLEQPSRSDALRLMALINFRLDNLDAARDDFEDLYASNRYTMEARFYLGRIADIRQETDLALELYSGVHSGEHAVIAQRRASALLAFEKDEPEKALQLLDDFADVAPEHAVDALLARAQLLASLERYDDALASYDRVMRFRPNDEGTVLGRGELLLRMGRLDEAIAAYRAAVDRWPDSAMSLNALGYTLADRTERYREAEKLIRKALRYDPESPAIIDSFGWVLYKRGRNAEALEQLEIAYDRLPDPEVAAHLVEVLAVMGREEEALEILAQAELRDPDDKRLQQLRKSLFAPDLVE